MMVSNLLRRQPQAVVLGFSFLACLLLNANPLHASESNLVLPDLSNPNVKFLGVTGHTLLLIGLLVCVAGLAFGLVIYNRLKNLPVHRSMLDVSELIYETCKTYLLTQGKFILLLWVFIAAIMVAYFGFLQPGAAEHARTAHDLKANSDVLMNHVAAEVTANSDTASSTQDVTQSTPVRVAVILLFSLIGIAGSYSVAWFGIRINTFANSRTAMASLSGKAFPICSIPLQAGMSIGMVLISVELLLMLIILLYNEIHNTVLQHFMHSIHSKERHL